MLGWAALTDGARLIPSSLAGLRGEGKHMGTCSSVTLGTGGILVEKQAKCPEGLLERTIQSSEGFQVMLD